MQKYFEYGDIELQYLKSKDKKLGLYISRIGYIKREVDDNLFSCVILNILGQQISTKALNTIWNRLTTSLKEITPQTITEAGIENIQSFGTSFKKASYIYDFANKVLNNELNLDELWNKYDEDIIKELSSLKGIGEWTAQMIMIFSMQRPNVFSYKDLAIHRGLQMVYRHKKITKELFKKYQKRFSPYCSVASLYLWEISSGKYQELEDKI